MAPVQLLFGPMLAGVFLNAILFGVMLVQMVIYYQAYKRDAAWIRYFVLFLFIAETLNTIFDIAIVFQPLVVEYGTPDAITFFPLFLPTDPLLTVIISTPIQIFIAYRIRVISKATWLAGLICVLAFASLGGGVWLTVTIVHIRLFKRKPELHWPALLWLLASAVADVTITVSLCWNLARRRTGFSKTDDAINRIIRLTIQTGLVTAIFAILDVVCFLAVPNTTINFVWDFALSKLYTNALLSTLNTRSGLQNLVNNTGDNVLFWEKSQAVQLQTYSTAHSRTINPEAHELENIPAAIRKNRQTSEFSEFNVSLAKEEDPENIRSYQSTQ